MVTTVSTLDQLLGPVSPTRTVALCSGGLDSTVLAYLLHWSDSALTLLSFNYGQRHSRELEYAGRSASALGADHHVVDLTGVTELLAGSALTDARVDVPDGHYTDTSMRATVVPNRNAIMLDIAVARAVSAGADTVAFGAHAGDHPIYPDCRPTFLRAYEHMARVANEGFTHPEFRVVAPFLDLTKADITRIGAQLGVPFIDTWSCYKGGAVHCGTCGTCVERREAFDVAGVLDPTPYHAGQGAR